MKFFQSFLGLIYIKRTYRPGQMYLENWHSHSFDVLLQGWYFFFDFDAIFDLFMKTSAFSSFLHLFCLNCCVVAGTILLLTLILFCSVLTQLGVNITGGSVFRVSSCECGPGFLKRNWLDWGPQSSQEAEDLGYTLNFLDIKTTPLECRKYTGCCENIHTCIFYFFATLHFRVILNQPPSVIEKSTEIYAGESIG